MNSGADGEAMEVDIRTIAQCSDESATTLTVVPLISPATRLTIVDIEAQVAADVGDGDCAVVGLHGQIGGLRDEDFIADAPRVLAGLGSVGTQLAGASISWRVWRLAREAIEGVTWETCVPRSGGLLMNRRAVRLIREQNGMKSHFVVLLFAMVDTEEVRHVQSDYDPV
jgi:hypothetical protein